MNASPSEENRPRKTMPFLLIGFVAGSIVTYLVVTTSYQADQRIEDYGASRNHSMEDLEYQFRGEETGGIHGLLKILLADGSQELSGLPAKEVLHHFQIPGLPMDRMRKIAIGELNDGEASMEMFFDFGEERTFELALPESKVWTINGKSLDVKKSKKPKLEEVKGHTITLKDQLQFFFNEKGILRVRSKDMTLSFFNLNFRTERDPNKILMHNDRIVLEENAHGKPLQKEGRYLPQRYDDWIIIESSFKNVEVPIPSVAG